MWKEETKESKMWFRRTNLRPEKCWQLPAFKKQLKKAAPKSSESEISRWE